MLAADFSGLLPLIISYSFSKTCCKRSLTRIVLENHLQIDGPRSCQCGSFLSHLKSITISELQYFVASRRSDIQLTWIQSKMKECFLAKTRLKEFSPKSKSWERANPTPSRKECSHKRFMLVLLGLFINSNSAGILQQEIKDMNFFLVHLQIHRA